MLAEKCHAGGDAQHIRLQRRTPPYYFTNRACAEARSVAKCGRDSSTLGPARRTPDHDPPAIPHSRTRLLPSCTHRCRSPGRRPLAMIWHYLTRIILVLLYQIPQCPTSCLWCLWTCSQLRASLCHSALGVTGVYRGCGPGGCGVAGVSTLLSCLRIC